MPTDAISLFFSCYKKTIHSAEILHATKFYTRENLANGMLEWYQCFIILVFVHINHCTWLMLVLPATLLCYISSFLVLLQPCCNLCAIHTVGPALTGSTETMQAPPRTDQSRGKCLTFQRKYRVLQSL